MIGTSYTPFFINVAFSFKEEGLLNIIKLLDRLDGLILY